MFLKNKKNISELSLFPFSSGTLMVASETIFDHYYSPALKKWGYTGFGLSVIPYSRNSVIP